jgi:hypothetical protein
MPSQPLTPEDEELRKKVHMKMLSKSDSAKNLGERTVVSLGFAVDIAMGLLAERDQQKELEWRMDELRDLLRQQIIDNDGVNGDQSFDLIEEGSNIRDFIEYRIIELSPSNPQKGK